MNMCYCGHPAERHKVMISHMINEYEYGKGKCTNCSCSEYALDEHFTKQEEEKVVKISFNEESTHDDIMNQFVDGLSGAGFAPREEIIHEMKMFSPAESTADYGKKCPYRNTDCPIDYPVSSTPIVEECGERCMCCTPKDHSDSISSCCSGTCKCHKEPTNRTDDCDFPKECKHGSTGRCEECLGKNISQAVLEERKRISDEVEKKLIKKARATDYNDRTEYDDALDIVISIITSK